MADPNSGKMRELVEQIRTQAAEANYRLTLHAHQELVEEGISLDELLQAIETSQVIENYPEHRRGACCLLNGRTQGGRSLHIVCTTAQPTLIIVTVYEPRDPKWMSPTQRRGAQ